MVESQTIYIVDDDEAVRDSVTILLHSAGHPNVQGYASARQFLDRANPQARDCVLLDIRMPDMDGLELQAELNRTGQSFPIIMMTAHGDVPIAVRAMKAGAFEFIEKPFSEETLLSCIDRALARAAHASFKETEIQEILRRIETLTPREREVMDGMISGQPNKVIAYDLNISPRTIEIHRARVMEKMQARSLSALVRMAVTAGIDQKRS
jgi:two-component system response regulator FixJ